MAVEKEDSDACNFIYNFINIDLLSGLKKGVYNGDILPVVYFSVIYTIVMIAM